MSMSKSKAVLGVLVVGGAAALIFLQYQTQQKLRAENDSLRQQMAQLKSDSPDASAANSKPAANDDFNELLRLRGEVSALRSQTNQIARLEQQNQQLQTSLTNAIQARQQSVAQSASQAGDERAHSMLQVSTSRQAVLAMILFANDHQDQFPTNFDQVGAYLGNSPTEATNLNQFEIAYHGSLSNVANPSSAILVRSTQPWIVNGKWTKVYGFVDGHSESHSDPNGNFDDWEQQHVAVMKSQ
jgi:cell division protein FtsB